MKFEDYAIPTTCPYCGNSVILTTNDVIYGRKYKTNGNCKCYACPTCYASVGTHADGKTPLGRMANKELKRIKIKAHDLFDPIWKSGRKKRHEAYNELAAKLGIPAKECHFGWFDRDMLLKAIRLLEDGKIGG